MLPPCQSDQSLHHVCQRFTVTYTHQLTEICMCVSIASHISLPSSHPHAVSLSTWPTFRPRQEQVGIVLGPPQIVVFPLQAYLIIQCQIRDDFLQVHIVLGSTKLCLTLPRITFPLASSASSLSLHSQRCMAQPDPSPCQAVLQDLFLLLSPAQDLDWPCLTGPLFCLHSWPLED